jgi:hypothetical protein
VPHPIPATPADPQTGLTPPTRPGAQASTSDPTMPGAVAGTRPLTPDPGTEGVLRGFQASRPPDLQGQPLNFGTVPVNPARTSALVSGESADPAKFNASLRELAGPNPSVSSTPMLLRDDKGAYGTANLFQVKGTDGRTYLMDSDGAHYTNFDDYLKNNQLPAGWTVTRPASLGDPTGNAGRLLTSPAHSVGAWDKVKSLGQDITGAGAFLGMPTPARQQALDAMGIKDGPVAAAVKYLGPAVDASPATPAMALALMSVGSLPTAASSGHDLISRYQHGRSVDFFTDPQARGDWVDVGSGVATLAGAGAGGAAAGGAGKVAVTGLGALSSAGAAPGVVSQGMDLHQNWSQLTPSQKVAGVAELGASAGMAAAPSFAGRLVPQGEAPRVPEGEGAIPGSRPAGQALERVGDFQSDQVAFQHYAKHAKGTILKGNGVAKAGEPDQNPDVPEFASFQQYRTEARRFMGGGLQPGSIEAVRPGGDLVRFDPKSGYFGIRSPQGVIRTFFRPEGGIDYYNAQFKSR